MKKYIYLTFFLLLIIPQVLFAQAAVESEDSVYLPQQGSNSVFQLERGYTVKSDGYIFNFISCIKEEIQEGTDVGNRLIITQQDKDGSILNDGSSNIFYFVKTDNQTIKKPFSLKYDFTRNRYTKVGGGFIDSTSEGNIYGGTEEEHFSGVTFVNMYTIPFLNVQIYNNAEFYVYFEGEGYGNDTISPGDYEARLTVKYLQKGNKAATPKEITQELYLRASYMLEYPENQTDYNYSFTLVPTSNSYNINLLEETKEVQIASVNFFSSIIGSTNLDDQSNKNYYSLGISSSSDWNDQNPPGYMFKKFGSGQEITPANHLKYTVSFGTATQNSSSPVQLTVPLVTHKVYTKDAFGRPYQYLDEFKLSADVKIKLDETVEREDLSSGQYSSTLYYFVISNF